ncbi:MAG: RluA family pseudouridine synthase [Fidelibacterota bacterium]
MGVLKLTADRSDIRLDRYLADEVEILSRTKAQHNINAHRVLVDGIPAKPSLRLSGGELIQIDLQDSREIDLEPVEMDLDVLYEDNDLVAINKPAGLVVHPGAGHLTGTLVNGLIYHFKELSKVYGSQRPGIVHRLDKDTSGVLLIAKNDLTHMNLSQQFAERKIKKVYLALVWGNPSKKEGVISGSIKRHPLNRKKFIVHEVGREAVTSYRVIESFEDFSLIELQPRTGRTHQLRVHMQSLGHSIFGDGVYGGDRPRNRGLSPQKKKIVTALFRIMSRQALHALSIRFYHPGQKQFLELIAPLSEDFQTLLTLLRPDYA